jgi:IPT/TIG domain
LSCTILSPASPGDQITIRGTGLGQTKAVTFNDAEVAKFTTVSDRNVTLKVPSRPSLKGNVVLTVYGPNNVAVEHDFKIT